VIAALTAYGVQIPKAFADEASAIEWAEEHGDTFPGCTVVETTADGTRIIWRHQERDAA
jgi:hypothetical protein